MESKETDIALLAAPFGFGPLGKALAIAHELARRHYSVKILGDEAAQQIIRASGFHAETYIYRQPLNLAELNTKLVVSCLDISTPIIKSDIPLVFVDSLFWLRGRWERLPDYNADLYIAQKFFLKPAKEALNAIGDKFHTVEAILPPASLKKSVISDDLVLLFPGGMRSPYLDISYQEMYLNWAVELIAETMAINNISPATFVTIVPPQLVNSSVTDRIIQIGGKYESGVGIEDVSKLLKKSRLFVTTPGLEIILEAYAAKKMPYLLPAYNGSQIPQLLSYRKAHIGREVCPTYAQEFERFESKNNNLSQLSIAVEEINLINLQKSSNKEEAIENLTQGLRHQQDITNHYPLGKRGVGQTVDLIIGLLRSSTYRL